jgi:hypothetical protein
MTAVILFLFEINIKVILQVQRSLMIIEQPQQYHLFISSLYHKYLLGVVYPVPSNIIIRDPIIRDPICSQNAGKITLVIMAGEKGTEIRDDKGATVLLNDYRSRHHLAVTIYEHTVYLFRVQLDCAWQLNTELFAHGCNLAQDVNVWIDLNNDGRFDESEMGVPYRWPVTSYMPHGIYDIQLNIPLIDGRYMRTGQHRMLLSVLSSEDYRRICGRIDYNETREYSVNIIPRSGYVGKYFSIYWWTIFDHTLIKEITKCFVLSFDVQTVFTSRFQLFLSFPTFCRAFSAKISGYTFFRNERSHVVMKAEIW